MRSDVRLFSFLAAAALLVGCGSSGSAGAAAAAKGVQLTAAQRAKLDVEPVQTGSYRPAVEVTATVDFDGDKSTQVLAPISGPVLRVLVDLGARVKPGTALATVSSPDFAAAVADYRKAEAAWLNARRIARRDSALFANDALARQDLEQAETDATSAAADRDGALDALRAIGADSATLDAIQRDQALPSQSGVIRAPIEGTVVERLVTPGQLLAAGSTPCFTIADMSTVWVMGNVFESDVGNVHVGDPADVTPTVGGDTLRGRVDYVGAEVDPDTRATAVRIVTPNPGRLLKKDMYVRVTIHSRHERSGLFVPTSAVLRDEDNLPFVFVVGPDSGFQRRHVTPGQRVGDRYVITTGLAPGDRVITAGGLFLQFAQSQ